MHNYLNLLFSCQGRINRLNYLKGKLERLLLLIPSIIFIFAPGVIPAGPEVTSIAKLLVGISYLAGFLLMVPYIVAGFALNIKRLRDIGLSPWWVLLNVFISIACFASHKANLQMFHFFIISLWIIIILTYFIAPTDKVTLR